LRKIFMSKIAPSGIYEYVIARTKLLDECYLDALENGFQQVVILGAGFDTRSLRFAEQNNSAKIFELDVNKTQQPKVEILNRKGVLLPEGLVFVPIDFNRQSLSDTLIRAGFLENQVAIDGVGVQGHLHGDSFDPVKLHHALDILAKAGLPLCITEFNFPGQRSRVYQKRNIKLTPEEEQAKAKALVDYYRICFAHASVKGILMWGFWERANWIPQSSLFLRDWTATPAAEAYRDLVFNQWWTRCDGKADKDGNYRIPAFFGTHRVIIDGHEKRVELKKSAGQATVSFK